MSTQPRVLIDDMVVTSFSRSPIDLTTNDKGDAVSDSGTLGVPPSVVADPASGRSISERVSRVKVFCEELNSLPDDPFTISNVTAAGILTELVDLIDTLAHDESSRCPDCQNTVA